MPDLVEAASCYPHRPATAASASPDVLVAVPFTKPIQGVIRLDSMAAVRKDRIGELARRIDPDTLEQVAIALRADLNL